MKSHPTITIITPTYNAASKIETCILSVARQTYPYKEHLIVDGSSSDGTLGIVERHAMEYPHIKFISEKDSGIYDAMNKGIEIASGEWLYFLGSDDVFYDESVLENIFSMPSLDLYDIVYGNVIWGDTGKIYDGRFSLLKLMDQNICQQAILYRKSVFSTLGCFNVKYKAWADWLFNIKSFSEDQVRVKYLDIIIAKFAFGGFSSVVGEDPVFINDKEKILYDNFPPEYLNTRNKIIAFETSLSDLEHREQQLLECERVISVLDQQLGEMKKNYALQDVQIISLNSHIQCLLNSFSWRITAPIRTIADLWFKGKAAIQWAWEKRLKRQSLIHYDLLFSHDLLPHSTNVDIIICIHNALSDVKRCLQSVVRHTFPPYKIILVDDGSKEETSAYLREFAIYQGATIIRNDHAKGYTFAANQGLRASTADYSVLLNSDTIVTPHWLDRMIMCAASDPGIGIVGPLSNTASWQSIPTLFDENGDWAENELPAGISIADMGNLFAGSAGRVYPRIPFLNGFCLLIKRSLIDSIGFFDETTFGKGYGEENDFCLRARKAGWDLVVADDVYVYHAQSKSYSHERRKRLSEQAALALVEKHGGRIIEEGVNICRHDGVIEGVRVRAALMFERRSFVERGRCHWEGKRLLFVLPIKDAGGGGNVVITEALAMAKMGINVHILNLAIFKKDFEKGYPNLPLPVIYAESELSVSDYCNGFDAVVATANRSVQWLLPLHRNGASCTIGYYIQDFEPHFFERGNAEFLTAWDSYTLIPQLVRFTKTTWNQEELRKEIDCDCQLVGPSFDVDLFRPRVKKRSMGSKERLRIAAMIRPESPRRNAAGTMKILSQISHHFGKSVDIVLFGTDLHDPAFKEMQTGFYWRNIGKLTSTQLAIVFAEVDIFVDFSTYQAMGLTAMEAMACGVAVILPLAGGASSFAKHEKNCLMVDTSSHEACCDTLTRLVTDHDLRQKIQANALKSILEFFPEKSAYKILEALFPTSDQLDPIC